jgi:hypothetical protein
MANPIVHSESSVHHFGGDINDYLDFSLGYRMLEGGAFNKNAYNRVFFNYYFVFH